MSEYSLLLILQQVSMSARVYRNEESVRILDSSEREITRGCRYL